MLDELGPELVAHQVIRVRAGSYSVVVVADRRVVLIESTRVVMALPFEAIRRAEFNVEADRPATLTIVPDNPTHPPQILRVEEPDDRDAAAAVAELGTHLNGR